MPTNQPIFTYAGAAEEDEQTAEGPQGGVRHRTGIAIFRFDYRSYIETLSNSG